MKIRSHTLLLFGVLAISLSVQAVAHARSVRLSRAVTESVKGKMGSLKNPVTLTLYSGGPGDRKTDESRVLLRLIGSVSSKVRVVERDLFKDIKARERLGTEYGPVFVFSGTEPPGITYYGYPEQRELAPFLDGILIASGRTSPLAGDTEAFLKDLNEDIHIKVFVSPD